MAIEGILFDFGGTLDADGEPWLDRTFALYERRGLHVPRSEVKQAFYAADEACVQGDRVRHKDLRELMAYHFEYQLQMLGIPSAADRDWLCEEFVKDAEAAFRRNGPTLAALSETYRLGILSNFYGNLVEICESAGIARHFRAIVDSTRVGLKKPDPAFFQLGLERIGTAPDRAAMVGDNVDRDILPAKGLGMKTFWVMGEGRKTVTRTGVADHPIQRIGDLLSCLG